MSQGSHVQMFGRVTVLGADAHPHAARRLKESWADLEWLDAAAGSVVPESMPTVMLRESAGLDEGAFRIEVDSTGAVPSITITGGPFSGVIFGVEELVQRISQPAPNGIRIADRNLERTPKLAYRTFWTWDHSTNWELNQIGHQEIGVFNSYGKPPGGFLADYRRMVDFCSMNQIAAIVIYGFFRDSHGGVAAAQELCRYANERGVRILPGIAIGAYGGVYWEGKHPYNLATWLDRNPGYEAEMERGVGFQLQDLSFPLSFPKSDYTRTACPSEPANIEWMRDAISWLVETVDVGGINIEAGDYGVCGCAKCNARRGERETAARRDNDAEFWSHADMADNFPVLFDAARSQRKDLWLYCELQWDNLLDPAAHDPLNTLPQGGIYQHTFNRSYWNRARTELTAADVRSLPTQTNVIRSQFACQWNGDERTERYAFNAPDFAELARTSAALDMQGLTVWGEPSPYHVSSELSYLAFGRFTYDPDLTWEEFMAQDVAPRVGGQSEADAFVRLMEELDGSARIDATRLRGIRDEALDAAKSTVGDAVRRWLWLADRASQRSFMGH
ncbi:hypothetical protein EV140_1153 [Microcella alkaliphila]|uniref:Uncharacterized protein n=1 Tax=Microcella alkaliphila TaxID=279828 RepID=A0A4Q7TKF6_9MICO|nr:hypothetical protein [Microcella alkaliphila]RZT60647.1 hypothetical protein EV140_1153 [Microcella alkaliphila]